MSDKEEFILNMKEKELYDKLKKRLEVLKRDPIFQELTDELNKMLEIEKRKFW